MREGTGPVLRGPCGVARCVTLAIVRRIVADPYLKAIQPGRAAIAPVPYDPPGYLLGACEIHPPPRVGQRVCVRPARYVKVPVVRQG
jgi:hypothetical protein